MPQPVPDDVTLELVTVWQGFLELFQQRADCIPDVTVWLVDDVTGGDARYLPVESRIEVAIPTSPRRFRESVAHELAHHLEHGCAEFSELRDALSDELDPTGSGWHAGDRWEEIPSERWAEHVVHLVNGERVRFADDIPLFPAVLDEITRWATA